MQYDFWSHMAVLLQTIPWDKKLCSQSNCHTPSPPKQKNILFFADLHELEQVKKIVKMTKKFSIPYPPPLQCEISPILFHCVGLLTISFILIITDQCYMGNIYIWWSFMFTFQRIHIVLTILLMRSPFSMDILFYDHHRPMLHCWDYNLNKLHILLAIFSFIL